MTVVVIKIFKLLPGIGLMDIAFGPTRYYGQAISNGKLPGRFKVNNTIVFVFNLVILLPAAKGTGICRGCNPVQRYGFR